MVISILVLVLKVKITHLSQLGFSSFVPGSVPNPVTHFEGEEKGRQGGYLSGYRSTNNLKTQKRKETKEDGSSSRETIRERRQSKRI